jgi:DnaJ-class molecular chaperone
MKNYYKILQVDQSAEKEVIEAAYKRLVKKYHPDKVKKKDEFSSAKIRDIIEAYKVLRDENKRQKYNTDLLRYTFNENIQANYGQEIENLVQRSIYCRCSNTKKLYKINLVK